MGDSKNKEQTIVVFESQEIRRDWHQEEWWFSVVDVVGVLMEQDDLLKARKYWNKLAQRLRDEGSEVVTNCHQLKMKAPDGKMRKPTAPIPKVFSASFNPSLLPRPKIIICLISCLVMSS